MVLAAAFSPEGAESLLSVLSSICAAIGLRSSSYVSSKLAGRAAQHLGQLPREIQAVLNSDIHSVLDAYYIRHFFTFFFA